MDCCRLNRDHTRFFYCGSRAGRAHDRVAGTKFARLDPARLRRVEWVNRSALECLVTKSESNQPVARNASRVLNASLNSALSLEIESKHAIAALIDN